MKTGFNTQLLFSPQNCTLEILDQTITPNRRKIGDEIIKKYIDNPDYINYTLLIGSRGSGKTHLLTYIFKSLVQHFNQTHDRLILRFSEEERGVADTMGFILACLRASDLTTKEISKIVESGNQNDSFMQIEELFDSRVGGRKVVLFIENLGQTLGYFDDDELSKLRGFFQTRPNISVVASAISLFKLSNKPDHPFYGFFSIRTLKPLNNKGAREFLRWLAELNNKPELVKQLESENSQVRVNAIYGLTGGNHRLLSMLSNVLDVNGLCELVNPFVQMIDRELTPYYQQRLDRLSPQQNNIIRVIAEEHGRAITVKEIAQFTFSTSQIVSKQCHLLKQRSYIRSIKIGVESCYELNEPLLRIVLDMKEGRDEPLPIIVNFLKYWYETFELKKLEAVAPPEIMEYYRQAQTALNRMVLKEGIIKTDSIKSEAARDKKTTSESDEINALVSDKQYDLALTKIEEFITQQEVTGEIANLIAVAKLLLRKATVYSEWNQPDNELRTYDEIINRFGESENPELMVRVAKALLNKGYTLGQLDQPDNELKTYDEIINRFGESENPELMVRVAKALFNKGITLGQLGKPDNELKTYEEVINRYGKSNNPDLMEAVANSLIQKGYSFGQLDQYDNSLIAYEEVIKRYGTSENPEIMVHVAQALFNKGYTFEQLEQLDNAIKTYGEIIKRYDDSDNPDLMAQVAMALVNKGISLGQLNQLDNAIKTFEEVIKRYDGIDNISLMVRVARALVNKGFALGLRDQSDDELKTYEEVINRYGESDNPELMEAVARALNGKGFTLGQLGQEDNALKSYEEVINRFRESKNPNIWFQLARAFNSKGDNLVQHGQEVRALKAYEEVINRFSDSKDNDLKEYVVEALINKADYSAEQEEPEVTFELYKKALALNPNNIHAYTTLIVFTFSTGKIKKGLRLVKEGIEKFQNDLSKNIWQFGTLLEYAKTDLKLLKSIVTIYISKNEVELMQAGIVKWISYLTPMQKETAIKLDSANEVLDTAFSEIPELKTTVGYFRAIRENALGDKKALMKIPLELRKLFTGEETDNQS